MKKICFFHALFSAMNYCTSMFSRSVLVQGICIRRPLKMQNELRELERVQRACMQSWRDAESLKLWNKSRRRPVSSLQIPETARTAKKAAFSLVEMKCASRCGWRAALSREPKHYDGDVGCEPCEFGRKQMSNRRNTHRSLLSAFSLVEMLMALLVASLILAALAPVMTKKWKDPDIKIMAEAAQYDKDALVSVYTGEEGEDSIFNLPDGVSMVKVIMVGGGGAGGNSFFGKQELTNSAEWTVPAGVKKLRFFMVGGGGGGASGGLGTGTAYGDMPAIGDGTVEKKVAGEYTFADLVTPPSTYKAPALDEACRLGGSTETDRTKWTVVSDGSTIEPNKVPDKISAASNVTISKVTACGGGGGGGGNGYKSTIQGGGGSGAYIADKAIDISNSASNIIIRIGGGGGYGASAYQHESGGDGGFGAGAGGGSGDQSWPHQAGMGGAGGKSGISLGGTARTTAYDTSSSAESKKDCIGYGGQGGGNGKNGGNGNENDFKGASGGNGNTLGGNGGSSVSSTDQYKVCGGGGGGDGVLGYGGGGGGSSSCGAAGGGGGGATFIKNGTNKIFEAPGGGGGGGGFYCSGDQNINCHNICSAAGGGGGGGAGGGNGGSTTSGSNGNGYGGTISDGKSSNGNGSSGGVISSNYFGSNNCNGGNARASGNSGAIKLWYSIPATEKALKCSYNMPANGSGGGGAGQLVVGEIDVTPGEKLYFEVGSGGSTQGLAGSNGNEGNPTRIRRGSSSGPIIAEALGGLPGQYSMSETEASKGGKYRENKAVGLGQTLTDNWTGITFNPKSGEGTAGELALPDTNLNRSYGGKGGDSQNMKGETLSGGEGGRSVKNGGDPNIKSYGAGGGGGAGSRDEHDTTFGAGGAGAGGYIYFEYGNTNGGGGTAGEIITKLITNLKLNSEIGISLGKGGDNATGDGNGTETVITYNTGSVKTLSARGGLRGNDGGAELNQHAEEKSLPCNEDEKYANCNDPLTKGQAGSAANGGSGGYIQELWENDDGTWASYVKAIDGKVGGPILGGCGGKFTPLVTELVCNGAANTPNGKNGTFGGGGGGGAVMSETGGLGGKGGKGMVIIKYKAVGL